VENIFYSLTDLFWTSIFGNLDRRKTVSRAIIITAILQISLRITVDSTETTTIIIIIVVITTITTNSKITTSSGTTKEEGITITTNSETIKAEEEEMITLVTEEEVQTDFQIIIITKLHLLR